MAFPNGDTFHGEILGVNVSSITPVVLYDNNGVARTLGAGERIIVKSYVINTAGAAVVTIFSDFDGGADIDSGEVIAIAALGALGGIAENSIEHALKPGKTIKVKSNATDLVYLIIRGEIISG